MKITKNHSKFLIAVVGPTSSGKSELAVILAKKMNGEIISGDSRQVYIGMDIGSGKIEGKFEKKGQYFYKGIPHYGIDIASPKKQYSVAKFKAYAQKCIDKILDEGKTPIICGGTGHWIDAVVYNLSLPEAKPNAKLRRSLEKKSAAELFLELKKLDPSRAQNIDPYNKRRLIRALEIIITTGKKIPKQKKVNFYPTVWIGINQEKEFLNNKIEKRLKERLKAGMFGEVKKLHKQGVSWKRLESFGLEYKFCSLFLQKKLTEQAMFDQLLTAIRQYSKRQMTWWKKNQEIQWVKNSKEALALFR